MVIDQAAGLGNIASPGVSKGPVKLLITSTSQLARLPNSLIAKTGRTPSTLGTRIDQALVEEPVRHRE